MESVRTKLAYTVPKLTDYSTAALERATGECAAACAAEAAEVHNESELKVFRDRWIARFFQPEVIIHHFDPVILVCDRMAGGLERGIFAAAKLTQRQQQTDERKDASPATVPIFYIHSVQLFRDEGPSKRRVGLSFKYPLDPPSRRVPMIQSIP